MQNRFFSSASAKYMKICYKDFIKAVKNGDSATIDFMLEARKNGCQLDDSDKAGNFLENGLEILLQRRDFINASKLIKAGADTCIKYKVWVNDDGPYPYGGYETKRKDFFDEFANQKDIITFLKCQVLNVHDNNDYKEAKKLLDVELEAAKQNVEYWKNQIKSLEELYNDNKQDYVFRSV